MLEQERAKESLKKALKGNERVENMLDIFVNTSYEV